MGKKKAGRFTSELPSFTNYNPMNISLIYLDFSNGSFKRGQKVAIWQLSILQNYNPMNISKFESGTSTRSSFLFELMIQLSGDCKP
jgi:hypothetical protein